MTAAAPPETRVKFGTGSERLRSRFREAVCVSQVSQWWESNNNKRGKSNKCALIVFLFLFKSKQTEGSTDTFSENRDRNTTLLPLG
jgi:hypothetical protein